MAFKLRILKRGQHVTAENLYKTRTLLNYEAYIMCKEKNISTEWTDDEAKAKEADMKFFYK